MASHPSASRTPGPITAGASAPKSRTARDEAVERLTNLSFALQGAANMGGNPDRSAGWIRKNVQGYQGKSDEAFEKALRRDVQTLQRAGVPIIHSVGEDDGAIYRMQQDEYQLPAVEFTPEEAMVLGVAGGMGQRGGMGDFSLSGWTKIAASGASRDLAGAPIFSASNDITRVDPGVVTAILTTVRNRLRITFQYEHRPDAPAEKRVMDPWGLVTHDNRLYLVGWDVDRKAPRTFRIINVSDVKRSKQAATHSQPTQPLQELVEEILELGETVDALVDIPSGRALELAATGKRRDDGLVELKQVSLDWLVRTAIGYAPYVNVIEPPEARERITAQLRAVAAQVGAQPEGGN